MKYDFLNALTDASFFCDLVVVGEPQVVGEKGENEEYWDWCTNERLYGNYLVYEILGKNWHETDIFFQSKNKTLTKCGHAQIFEFEEANFEVFCPKANGMATG